MNYYGTIEYIRHGEAIVTLTDSNGEWSGSGLICCRSGNEQALYEEGYKHASINAASKGGRLETFRVGSE